MEVFMKTTFIKMTFAAVIIIFAMFLGTCAPQQFPESEESGVEYTDVEYEIYGGVGNERVKSIKLYFDGYKVPVTPKQRAIQRALSLDTAAASHDFFEVVFYTNDGPATGTTDPYVARASWEIGHPAGISGVHRPAPGVNYGPVFNGTGTAPNNTATPLLGPCSVVFVGKKTNKTLLGVGWLTHVGTNASTTITDTTTSVTFYVAPLKTWLGYYDSSLNPGTTPAEWSLRGKATIFGDGVDTNTGENVTFRTATGPAAPATTGPWPAANVSRANTRGTLATFPISGGSASYPLFALPASSVGSTVTTSIVSAIYTIGGLSGLTHGPGNTGSPAGPASLWPAVRIYGIRGSGTDISPHGGLQVIKRRPTFSFRGRTYEAGNGAYDGNSKVDVDAGYNGATQHVLMATAGVANGNGDATSTMFKNEIPINITITSQSGGVFAFAFQSPVFAITTRVSDNDGSPFTKWFVRPADGSELYLLDNGIGDGGMVLLGDQASMGADWIEITTVNIGFDNN
jgi:hypothetical protein